VGGDYELLEVHFGEGARRVYLSGACPSSGKPFYEAVPPETTTVEGALTWREWGTFSLPETSGITGYYEPEYRT
jgi:hypothetical protein